MRKLIQPLLLLSSVLFLIVACEREEEGLPTARANETTIVKFTDGGHLVTLALDIQAGFTPINVLEVRRETKTLADLNKQQVIKILRDNSVLSDFSGAAVSALPESAYQQNPSVPFNGTEWELTFEPGEFVKWLVINVNTSALSGFGRVGLGFRIVDASGADIHGDLFKGAVEFSAKNAYDGVYQLTWTNYHPTANPGYTGSSTEVEMRTTGIDKVKLYWPLAAAYCCPSILNGGLSYFGAQEPEYTISGSSVTVQNAFNGAVTFYTMAPGFTSTYDANTRTIVCKWGYNYTGGAFDPASTREWSQTFVYLRPR